MDWTSAMAALLLTLGASMAGQPPVAAAEVSGKRVARLALQFESLRELTAVERRYAEACRRNCEAAGASVRRGAEAAYARRQQLANDVAARIHSEVDNYVARAITPGDLNRQSVERGLQVVLASASSEPPAAFTSDENGPWLAVVYSLTKAGVMGPGGTSVTLRMYVRRNQQLVPADATGSELDGYASISVLRLPPPAPGDAWFLVAGKLTGANGPNTRMRIYAYDGLRFRTVWMPENVWGDFAIAVTDAGFTVKGTYYRGGTREERYAIAADGVYRVPPETPDRAHQTTPVDMK